MQPTVPRTILHMDVSVSHGGAQQRAVQGAWQAPSAIERGLYEARQRGDWPACYDLLAKAHLYMAQSRAAVDAGKCFFHSFWNPKTHSKCVAVYTAGMLPAPTPDPVYDSHHLGWFARVWEPGDPPYLVVNPGSPCEVVMPASPEGRALWQQHDVKAEQCGLTPRAVHTLDVGGPRQGPVAFGLAAGAHISVNNGKFWNAMAYHGNGYRAEKETLERWWGVTNREEWLTSTEQLLRADMVSGIWEFVLQLRRSLALDFASPVSVDHWREAAERVIRRRAEEVAQPRLTPDGVTQGSGPSPAELASQVAGVQRLIGRIARYEARFRADGLLRDGGYIRTVEAWDYGRAAGMARWGLGARYGTLAEAESAVIRAGRLVHANYRSWADFSAAYALGRCLHFDEEEFGTWYEEVLEAHRVLTTDPASPWLTIPWE